MIIWVNIFILYINLYDFCIHYTYDISSTAILYTILWNSWLADF